MSLCRILLVLLASVWIMSCENEYFDLAIENVQVFDAKTGRVVPAQTILIKGDRIGVIMDYGGTYRANQVIDGKGRLVTPGFIDTHIHLSSIFGVYEDSPEIIPPDSLDEWRQRVTDDYLPYGSTTLVEMGGPDEWMSATIGWQNNSLPHHSDLLVTGGALISDEEREPFRGHAEVADPVDARRKVNEYAAMGVNHLKLYWRLRAPEMEAIMDEATKLGLVAYGHIDEGGVTIQDAMGMGVRHFEHLLATSTSIYSNEAHYQLMAYKYNLPPRLEGINEYLAFRILQFKFIRETPELHEAYMNLLRQMAKNGASLSTTIHLLASVLDGKTFFRTLAESSQPVDFEWLSRFDDELVKEVEEAFDISMDYLKQAHDLGVNIRIGTDCQDGGKALWSELLLLSQHGFDMAEVLQIATFNGAKAMKLEAEIGRISPGKKANLVLFERDPFANEQNLLSDKTVIKDGVLVYGEE